MAFEAFTGRASSGALHQRRAIAYAAAACVLVGLGLASARVADPNGAERLPVKEPDPVDVVLEEKVEEEKPKEPEPPPPVAVEVPAHVKISAEPPPPPPKEPDPDAKAKLDEADPSKDKGVAGGAHEGDPNGVAGGTGKKAEPPPPPCGGEGQACCAGACNGALECTAAQVCKKPAPPPPPPKPKASLVSEDDTPAKGLSTPPPGYPAAARAAGIQGAVVVRLTIDEAGNVVDAKIVKGDPNFDEVVLPAVKAWKYEPAKHQDGKPFLSVKTVKIPFKIKL